MPTSVDYFAAPIEGFTLASSSPLEGTYKLERWEGEGRHLVRVRNADLPGPIAVVERHTRTFDTEREALEYRVELMSRFAGDSWLIPAGREINITHEIGDCRVEQLLDNGRVHRYRLVRKQFGSGERILAWSGERDTDDELREIADALAIAAKAQPDE